MNGLLPARILRCCAALAMALPSVAAAQEPAPATPRAPRVWIFNGTPGNDEHHAFYEGNLTRLRKALTQRLGVPAKNLTVLYGPQSAGYDGVCTRANVLAEIGKAVAVASADQPVWLIFEGHSNPTAAGANFNLAGPDVTSRELREALAPVKPDAQLAVIFTTSSSGRFLHWISGPGRCAITATLDSEEDNETEFPHVLASVLEDPASDVNRDGRVSLLEIFNGCNAGVKAVYERGGYMQRERAMLDGNGDRRATQRPAREDAEPASKVAFTIAVPHKKSFD